MKLIARILVSLLVRQMATIEVSVYSVFGRGQSTPREILAAHATEPPLAMILAWRTLNSPLPAFIHQ